MKDFLSLALVAAVCSALAGCSISNPQFLERVTATNGVVTEKSLRVTQWAMWPATQSVAKQRASLGRTFSFGSEGMEQESTGTNAVELVKSAAGAFGEGLMRGAKP